MARERLIVPIFIPHEGCPYRCVFCNQGDITGMRRRTDAALVSGVLRDYLESRPAATWPPRREAAFYGGSFTGLPLGRQEHLLSLIQPWLCRGSLHSIRVSTHPLFVDSQRLELLRKYGVQTVELGLQSTDPEVLKLSGRPCSLETVRAAVNLIRGYGFQLGLQLMPGLPGDGGTEFQNSVDETIQLRPDFVRLYPALVMRHTPLYQMYRANQFVPWSLEYTLEALKAAVLKFRTAKIPVARIGLHPDPSMLANLVDGPCHPSMRYLVDCRIGLDEMVNQLSARKQSSTRAVFKVPARRVSIYAGHKRENIVRLKKMFRLERVTLQASKNLDAPELVS